MKTKTWIVKTRTLTRESPVTRKVKELLSEQVSVRSIEFWKSLGESSTLQRARSDPKLGAESADIVYLSKDRSHCVLLDCHVSEKGLSEKQAFLYLSHLAHLLKNREFPIKTAVVIFLVPEKSPMLQKLLATFTEGYKIPTAKLRGSILSAAGIKDRGTRMAKNAYKYSVGLTYKEQKFDFQLTVKVVEAPGQFFEGKTRSLEFVPTETQVVEPKRVSPPLPKRPASIKE